MRLIFLSGPSGGGKSTFLELLKAGALPPDLRCHFDPDAHRWPAFDITNQMRAEIARSGAAAVWNAHGTPAAAILHYDIVAVPRARMSGFSADPAFQLLDDADDVQVIFVRPAPARLMQQFTTRNDARKVSKANAALAVTRPLRTAFDRTAERFGFAKGSTERALYSDAAAVERIYADWLDFAEHLAREHGNRPVLTLAPAPAEDAKPAFTVETGGGT